MERLTDKREADAQRREYEKRLENGYPRNIPEERYLKLAAYEDTGLEPEEVLTGKELAETACAVNLLKEYQNIGSVDRFRELAQAEKDGRLVVLPCKAGDTVYSIEPLWLGAIVCEESKCRTCDCFYEGGMGDYPSCLRKEDEWCLAITEETATLRNIVNWMAGTDFGKTVFLTREEAEAALKKREEGLSELGNLPYDIKRG